MVPSDDPDYDYDDGNKPAFSFDNDTKMNLDGPGYALSLLLIGEIVILAMAFFVGGLGFGGRSFSSSTRVSCSTFPQFSIIVFKQYANTVYDLSKFFVSSFKSKRKFD